MKNDPKTFSVSLVQNKKNEPLSKELFIGPSGKLQKKSEAYLTEGTVTKKSFSNIIDFGEFAINLNPTQALTFGLCQYDSADVVSSKLIDNYESEFPIVTRTRDNFEWSDGAGIMFLDYDPSPESEPMEADELVKALRKTVPELNKVTIVTKPSASSCIYDKAGNELRGVEGQHVFLVCKNANDIPELGKIIFNRLWLAGYGYIKLSKNGGMLVRTIIDDSVWQPERLSFSAAKCSNGLFQKFPDLKIFPSDSGKEECLDVDSVARLTAEEHQQVANLIEKAKQAKQVEANIVREKWAKKQAVKSVGKNAPPEVIEERKRAFISSSSQQIIIPEHILYPKGGKEITAKELINNPDKWDRREFADPMEPDYGNDPRIAIAILKECDEPYIYSHAHGGIKYYFRSEEQRLQEIANSFEYLEPKNDINHKFPVIPAAVYAAGEPPPWRIHGVIPETGLAMIYGPSGSGKSFLAFDIVAAIAQGKQWRNKRVQKGKVVYVLGEGFQGFKTRLRAYAEYNSIDLSDLDVGIIHETPNLTQDDDKLLIKSVKSSDGADIIVLDTLAQMTPGADENTASEMGPFLERCKRLQKELNALILIVHHSGKDSTKGARGWSGIRAALDTEIEIKKSENGHCAIIKKQKDGEDGEILPFGLQSVYLGLDKYNEKITSCVLLHHTEYERKPTKLGRWQKKAMIVMDDLFQFGDQPVPVTEVISAMIKDEAHDPGPDPKKPKRDRRRETAKRTLNELNDRGLIIIEDQKVKLPQIHNEPQSENVENLNPQPHFPHDSMECGNVELMQ